MMRFVIQVSFKIILVHMRRVNQLQGGGGGENPEKTNLHTHKQNLVCVTRDCKTDQLGSKATAKSTLYWCW